MSKVTTGYSKPYVAKYTNSGTTVTYSNGMLLGRGVNVTLDIDQPDDNDFYADNVVSESETGTFTKGTMTVTVDSLIGDAAELVLGLPAEDSITVDSSTVKIRSYGSAINPPYVGYGHIARMMENGVTTYHATVFPKTKFQLPGVSAATQEDQIDWQTQELAATVLRDDTDAANWMRRDEVGCATEAEAEAVLKTMLSITE